MILSQTPVDTYGLLDKSGSLIEDLNLPHFLMCETRFSVSRVSRSLNIQLLPSRGFSWAAPQTWCWSWHFTVTAPVWQEEEEQGAMLASCTPGDRHPTRPLSYVWLFTTRPQIRNWIRSVFCILPFTKHSISSWINNNPCTKIRGFWKGMDFPRWIIWYL